MQSNYNGPRILLSIIGVFGWLALVAGLGQLGYAFMSNNGAVFVTGLSSTVTGILTIALSSVGKAMFDTAENTGAMVAILRERAADSRPVVTASEAPGPKDEIVQTYRGEAIVKRPGGFLARGRVFTTIEDARTWIDQHLA